MYVAIDVGGTNIRIASFDSSNNLLKKELFKVEQDFDSAMQKIVETIKDISQGERIEGIGAALPGTVDIEKGYIEDSSNLPGWNKKPFVEVLQKEFDTKVEIENDVAVAAMGEAEYGSAKGRNKFVYIAWGTGVGGAYVEKVKGILRVLPTEVGHQIIEWNGRLCACGQKGCAEAYIGGVATEKQYGKPLSEIKDEKIWDEIALKASQMIINTTNFFPVDLIVFSGGVINNQKHLLEKIKQIVDKELKAFPVPEMTFAKFGDDTTLYGGLTLIKN
jgi:glucokinase